MKMNLMSCGMLGDGFQGLIDADTLVSVAAANGLTGMDILEFEFELYGKEAMLAALEKYKVHCDCVISRASFFDKTKDEITQELETGLQLTRELGNKVLMVVAGRYDEEEIAALAGMTREQMMEKAVRGYTLAVKLAAPDGITVIFENTPHAMKPLASAEDCEELLKAVPGLGFVFDSGNFRIAMGDYDVMAAYERLKSYIVRVHVKDIVTGDFDALEVCADGQKLLTVVSGSGIVPVRELLHALRADGYDGVLAVEYFGADAIHGEQHRDVASVYCRYIKACWEGEPLTAKHSTIPCVTDAAGALKPVSRLFMGTAIWPMLKGENVDHLLDIAMSYGINCFDCARGYGNAELSLGGWISRRNNRERIVLLTKCGNADMDGSVSINRAVIESELAQSLECLGTDYIDIYLLHRDDPNTPVGEIIETLNEAQRAGRIRVFGVSNWTHERIIEANRYAGEHGLTGLSVSSPNFGLAEQFDDPWGGGCVSITGKASEDARRWYRENQMPVLAYSSLARGLMAGKISSADEPRAAELLDPPCVKGYVCHDNFVRLARVEELSKKTGYSVSQLAVAWMFTQGLNLFALVSFTKPEYFPGMIEALSIDLSKEDAAYLNLEGE